MRKALPFLILCAASNSFAAQERVAVCAVRNLDDLCASRFTPGQIERAIQVTGAYRPSLVPW